MSKRFIMNAFLESLGERPITFQRVYARLTGNIHSALFLAQATYWTVTKFQMQDRGGPKHDGWFWKTREEWQEETTLSRDQQESSRKTLRQLGILEEKLIGVPAKLWYRIDLNKLAEMAESQLGGKSPTGRVESSQQEGDNPPNITSSETTAEITTQTIHPVASAPVILRMNGEPTTAQPKPVRQEKSKSRVMVKRENPDFVNFWDEFPAKQRQQKAKEAWELMSPPLDEVLAGIERWKYSKQWQEGFFSSAHRFISEELWKETPPAAARAVSTVGVGPNAESLGIRPNPVVLERIRKREQEQMERLIAASGQH